MTETPEATEDIASILLKSARRCTISLILILYPCSSVVLGALTTFTLPLIVVLEYPIFHNK